MEWSKIKNIVLLILLTVNLLLLVLVVYRQVKDARYQESALTNAVEILSKNGIALSSVPEEMSLLPQQIIRDSNQESVIAQALLGSTTLEDRGAGVYRYISADGNLQFHSSGEFSATFSPGAVLLESTTPAEYSVSLLSTFNSDWRLTNQIGSADDVTITAQQFWNGAPILPCAVTLFYSSGSLISISGGQRLNGTPITVTGSVPISAATALIRFLSEVNALGDVCSEISSMTEAYKLSAPLSGPITLTPVWCVETDTSSYLLDALTGDLTRTT